MDKIITSKNLFCLLVVIYLVENVKTLHKHLNNTDLEYNWLARKFVLRQKRLIRIAVFLLFGSILTVGFKLILKRPNKKTIRIEF